MNPRTIELKEQLTHLFEKTFSAKPEFFFQAPGRVNLIGEHTDYNDGFVMPCAIDYQAMIAATPRDDNKIVVTAASFDGQVSEFELTQPVAHSEDAFWSNYVRGVADVLLKKGYELKGANLAVTGNVPQGAGLSSSACLEVVTGLTLSRLAGHDISLKELALIGQQAENEFVGCNCGIMDQMVSACGEDGHAMLLDCRSLETTSVSIPEGLAVVIINSNIKRGLVDSEYNTRRQQCETAAAHYGVKALRDINVEQLESGRGDLDEMTYRRAKHVVTENQRTVEAAEAMKTSDVLTLGRLMAESHVSMRDDFEVTVPGIDAIVEIVKDVIGDEGGVRMTGGGFGGCIVALTPEAKVDAVKEAVAAKYPAVSNGLVADIYVCTPSQGASTL
ncbi:galactokinase [Endozoicomonas sp. OPT23]|uniref:galactokinase n=1 Tax=Endozoicomonas sp. OPT23 TaxID=2072845 RepID=UPI00129BCA45|nr:galactokinase [Endozoicomonas sp. OPT23]MRI32628.1 galactokinase [Endozoicomonas sp. OPT23]